MRKYDVPKVIRDRGFVGPTQRVKGDCTHCGENGEQLPKPTVLSSAAESITAVIKHGFKPTSAKERDRRYGICQECEHLKKNRQCGICYCFVAFKSAIEAFHCPIKKW